MFTALYTATTLFSCLAGHTWAEFTANDQNLFVYFSQSSGRNSSLDNLCNSAAIDVVILGFVRSFTGTAGYPTIDFGSSNCNETRRQDEAVAPGLAVCTKLGQQVKRCQKMGKRVFLSIGGSSSNTSFNGGNAGRNEAKEAAKSMWNLFGGGTDSPLLRPFGQDVVIDGYDIDHEQGSSENYDVFISRLRSLANTGAKPTYISTAPLCKLAGPDSTRATLALVDFVFIRFYNSASCAMGTPGFCSSLQQWYRDIIPSPHLAFPKVLLGGLSFDNGNSGYVPAERFRDAICVAKKPGFMCFWNADKFGGVMLWDGTRGVANMVNEAGHGIDYLTYVKNVLVET
ncbi:unnamed protein product [Periconia digitata]|uniref:GH18 domain-containing protein n=1 Tax=Periconia digitata TaxID=1303443 RepID=A0A9W4XGV7_9PLEO|nr:unnamed protein product [Periconia digitata]